jgi:predicted ATPase/DNA-binding SARP family transcriptional activator
MSNLPLSVPPLIGREQDLHTGLSMLSQHRLVTLTGPGGCGKTSLVLRLASIMRAAFSDGVWVVELAQLSDPDRVPEEICNALRAGRVEGDGAASLSAQEQVVAAIQHHNVLLVLDNCEHLISACADLVEALLQNCPQVRILATSREALKCREEVEWLIPPLDLPPRSLLRFHDASAVSQIRSHAAIELFIERARVAVATFDLTAVNAALVARVCHRLDGLPLAIELAARYVKVLSLQEIDEGIASNVRFLASAQRTAPARHQTLYAAIDWSYHLLPSAEQTAFRRLCALTGAFGTQLAAVVCDVPHERIYALLLTLVDASIVQVVRDEDMARYRILETIKQFGLAQLIGGEEHSATCERYAQWAETYVAATSRLERENPKLLLDCFEREYEHLRAALQWMQSQGMIKRALLLALRLIPFWRQRGYIAEGRHWLEALLAQHNSTDAAPFLATAYNGLGVLAMWQGDFEYAYGCHETALALLRDGTDDTSNRATTAMTLFRLGFLAEKRGDYAVAEHDLEQSLLLYDAIHDSVGAYMARSRLSLVYSHRGEHKRARAYLEESLAFYRALRAYGPAAAILLNLGVMSLERGQLRRATFLMEESLRLNELVGDRFASAFSLTYLGIAILQGGDVARAEERLRQALELARSDRNSDILMRLFDGLAMVAALQGDFARAACLWGSAAAVRSAKGIPYGRAEKRRYDRALAGAKLNADAHEFQLAWQEGATLSLEAALARAAEPFRRCREIAHQDHRSEIVISKERVPNLHINALGSVRVWRDGQELGSTDFVYAKAQELLLYLLSSPPRTKEQICLALWPDADQTHAYLSFRVVLYHLRRVLGRRDWVVRSRNLYSFNHSRQDACLYDVDTFEAKVEEAERLKDLHPKRACLLMTEAISLYGGEFAESLGAKEWATPLQDRLRQRYHHMLLTLASLYLEHGRARLALKTFQQLIALDRYAEEAHRGVIRCYVKLHDAGRAADHYRYLCHVFKTELGVSPAPQTLASLRPGRNTIPDIP